MAIPKTITMKSATQQAMRFQGTDDKLQDVTDWVGGIIFRDATSTTMEFPNGVLPQNQGGGHIWIVVHQGEWVVQRAEGDFYVMTDAALKAEYDVVG